MADGHLFNSISLGGRGGTGLIHEVFILIMRGLSGAKVTRPGKFRSCQDGYAVKSSLKAEDGVLYPLEKGFFFLPKPPTLILHEEIDYVEFERHAAGGANMHYFDLLIRLKSEQEHLFRNIQRNEYHNLFDFISGKGLKIMNLGDIRTTDGVTAVLQNDDDDAVDPHLERIKNAAGGDESDEEWVEDWVARDGMGWGGWIGLWWGKGIGGWGIGFLSGWIGLWRGKGLVVGEGGGEGLGWMVVVVEGAVRWWVGGGTTDAGLHHEKVIGVDSNIVEKRVGRAIGLKDGDEDFVADGDDGGSPTDDSGNEESDASESGGEKEKPAKKESKKELAASKASSSRGKSKDGDEDGSKKRKQKKKKDPNAPKRAMSGFMFFSQSERENIKKTNPGIAFTDVGRVLGEKWKKLSAEEKEPFEAKAQADKMRYKDEISGYKNPQPMTIDSGNESDSA
ncbi:hypothetical protein TEA_026234 [Camellia sinensis var. sinensis]|uniref:FACT complex subunit SSRP1 n=1 Tax=Camellia sinensis var. sinensis TaxID=542762 RepID=A0A4S4ER57_CAMSN|nr:hypothetical protein TEA_026234 [Camellia sinensis var. sinensis]